MREKNYIFDLKEGDRFLFCHRVMEVISPFGTEGIPYGFGTLANTRGAIPENCVLVVDVGHRSKMHKFAKNIQVYAY